MENLTKGEKKIFRSLSTPKKIQDFLNTLKMRTDDEEPIVRSPRKVLIDRSASCMEGALLAAAILKYNGYDSLLLDLNVGPRNKNDVDHVVALFKQKNHWGALSKTSHAVLRYREPIYKNMRELALSFFHEYFTDDGKKNLRSFSSPFDICKKYGTDWMTSSHDLFEIAVDLDESPHTQILSKEMERGLRLADKIEITAGKLKESY